MIARVRERREKGDARRAILDAAREVFVEEGFDNASMRKIADRTDYTPTTIYLYFKDKAELLTCLCEETFANLTALHREIRERHKDPLKVLEEGGRAYVRFGLEHPDHYRVTFMLPAAEHKNGKNGRFRSAGEKAFDFLRTTIAEAVRQKRIRDVDVETTSQMCWTCLHGVTSLLITHCGFPWVDRDRLIDHTLETLIRGLKE